MDNVVEIAIHLAHGHAEGRGPARELDLPGVARLPAPLRVEDGGGEQQEGGLKGDPRDGRLVRKPAHDCATGFATARSVREGAS